MKWLHSFSISKKEKLLIQSYDPEILLSLLGVKQEDLQIIWGFWDQHVQKELKIV